MTPHEEPGREKRKTDTKGRAAWVQTRILFGIIAGLSLAIGVLLIGRWMASGAS